MLCLTANELGYWISTGKHVQNIEILSGYLQLTFEEECQILTAFIAPLGLYKGKRLPLGLLSLTGITKSLV